MSPSRNRGEDGTLAEVSAEKWLARICTQNLVPPVRMARAIQAADRLALGEEHQASGFVVVNDLGEALSPHALTCAGLECSGPQESGISGSTTRGTPGHAHAPPGCTTCAYLAMVRTCLESVHDGDVRAFAACGTNRGGTELREGHRR